MNFNSLAYVAFFVVVAAAWYGMPARWRTGWLLCASLAFYMSWMPVFVLLIFYTTTIDYFVARRLATSERRSARRAWLAVSLVTNLGALFCFKYYDFAARSLHSATRLLGAPVDLPLFHVILPIGISFYTFEALSYTIDVYRGRYQAETSYPRLLLFIMFFPKLIAGPVERAGHLIHQFDRDVVFEYDRVRDGLARILWGTFKKVVVADRLALYVDAVFNNPHMHVGITFVIATVFFAFQIYCDFSGYSDIAIGSAQVLGIDLLQNFRRPYFASSLSDFWSRWHISLTTWFRDYVYIPLGGNRTGPWHSYRNIFVVFLLSGLWHGANWTFVVWGALHGALLMGERSWARVVSPRITLRIPAPIRVACTFAVVTTTWLFFRANSIGDALFAVHQITGDFEPRKLFTADGPTAVYAALGVMFIWLVELAWECGLFAHLFAPRLKLVRWVGYVTLLLTMLLIGVFDGGQFIYFQF